LIKSIPPKRNSSGHNRIEIYSFFGFSHLTCGSVPVSSILAFHGIIDHHLLEAISKPPLGLKSGVEPKRSILKIFHIFLRLNASPRLPTSPEGFDGHVALNPI
jgi:hypothetical protein